MESEITWHLKRSPSALANLFRAFATFGKKRHHAPPIVEAVLTGLVPDQRKYSAFLAICGIPPRGTLHPLYPHALCYPLSMRILTSRPMPFSMTQILNTRNVIVQRRPISIDEKLNLRCCSTLWRAAHNGCELDLILEVSSGKEQVWHGIATYLVRGASADMAGPEEPRKRLVALETGPPLATWRLEPSDRVRFAHLSGDVNGLHLASWYAKRFGFARDFAQPLRVVTRCVDHLPASAANSWPVRLEFHLKGPVYYASNLILQGAKMDNQYRFDLYLEGDTRPSIVGQMGHLSASDVGAP